MKCKKCGYEINTSGKYCQSCGNMIEERERLKRCFTCNKEIDGKSQFCPHCGTENKSILFSKNKVYKFNYQKEVAFGTNIIETIMEFKTNKLIVEQRLIRFLRKTQVSITEVEPLDIISIKVKKRIDLWSILATLLFLFVGSLMPYAFLVIPLFLWMGYHKDLYIYTRRGVLRIPVQASNIEFENMMKDIRQFNPKLIVNF